jgi:RND family efflux transporter MFP subunit
LLNEYRGSVATYENAIFTARTVIANAVASKVALSKAEQALKDMTIRAPTPRLLPPSLEHKGRVTYGVIRRQVSEGQMIKEGESIAELVIEDPLRLWSNVPEQFVGQVKVGQPVRITTRAHPGKTFDGRIVRISPAVDSSNRTFQVETLIPNEKGLLRPGGFARATIVTDATAQATVVPIESIVQFAGVTRLFVVEDGKVRSIDDLKIGEEGLGWAEVISKRLPATGRVVTTGMSQLADGTQVTIREPEPKTPKAGDKSDAAAAPAEPKQSAAKRPS